jgi:hypothetical protein
MALSGSLLRKDFPLIKGAFDAGYFHVIKTYHSFSLVFLHTSQIT